MRKRIKRFVSRLQNNVWYALLFIVLAVLSLSLLTYEHLADLDEKTVTQILEFDIIIAYFFLFDFSLGLFFNDRYSHKDHRHHMWLDLLASIPVGFELVRVFRILRVFRALRVLSSSVELYFARKRYQQIKH